PPAQRDAAAIEAAIAEAEALLVILDAALGESEWLSGAEFGVGDIAVAPFIWNMMGAVDRWQPHPNLQRWSQQLSRRPAYQSVVMIPVT
ncbi:TPA: glutathione S-transferase C-terminal domain-containing protein, partial [Pluralibacter gergoviae]|nr:glutathione S-transferase C-terminal domain-containing protein [Pluralibacter gergoviae]